MGPSDRIQVIPYPYALPSKCVICGAGPGSATAETGEDPRTYIDFGFQLDDYGAVYFCSFCIVNLADALGFVGPGPWMSLQEDAHKLTAENEVLRAENEEFRRVYSTLRGLGALASNSDVDAPREHAPSEDNDGSLSKSIPKPRSSRAGSNKSSSVEGPGNIPESDGDKPADAGDDDLSF